MKINKQKPYLTGGQKGERPRPTVQPQLQAQQEGYYLLPSKRKIFSLLSNSPANERPSQFSQ